MTDLFFPKSQLLDVSLRPEDHFNTGYATWQHDSWFHMMAKWWLAENRDFFFNTWMLAEVYHRATPGGLRPNAALTAHIAASSVETAFPVLAGSWQPFWKPLTPKNGMDSSVTGSTSGLSISASACLVLRVKNFKNFNKLKNFCKRACKMQQILQPHIKVQPVGST